MSHSDLTIQASSASQRALALIVVLAAAASSTSLHATEPTTPQAPPPAPVLPVVLEDFEGSYTWTGGNTVEGHHDYNVTVSRGGGHVLHAAYIPGTDGNMIYKKVSWNCLQHPILKWRWKVIAMPTGAKLNVSGKSDASAQIYVGWRISGRLFSLKYHWAETDPVGMTFRAGKWNPFGTYQGIVIRSGGALDTWVTESRNVVADFKDAFGALPPENADGIGILTDGDGTKTLPVAEYDDFVATP